MYYDAEKMILHSNPFDDASPGDFPFLVLRVRHGTPSAAYHFIKRTLDIVFSLLALIILSPLMLMTAAAVCCDGGPAFYRQVRLTKDGRCFRILKFRSMHMDAEKHTGAILSTGSNDPRVTRVGRIIRRCKIDELPQLFNIIAGDMSIVGPRPERPEIAGEIEKQLPEFRLRLQVKAGLTGYAQLCGDYHTAPQIKLSLDLAYISNRSTLNDLRLILATPLILIRKHIHASTGKESNQSTHIST